jgi:hypothetical protein
VRAGNPTIQMAKPRLLSHAGCPTALAGHRIVPCNCAALPGSGHKTR